MYARRRIHHNIGHIRQHYSEIPTNIVDLLYSTIVSRRIVHAQANRLLCLAPSPTDIVGPNY